MESNRYGFKDPSENRNFDLGVHSIGRPFEIKDFLYVWKGYKKHLLYSLQENVKRAFCNWELNKKW